MKKIREDTIVFFESEMRKLSEAGALVVRRMIEQDVPLIPEFPKGMDTYKWLSEKLGKSERSLRGWAYNWSGPSGFRPNILDFFNIVYITKSRRGIEFLEELIKDATPEQRKESHGNVMKKVAMHIKELAETIERLANSE